MCFLWGSSGFQRRLPSYMSLAAVAPGLGRRREEGLRLLNSSVCKLSINPPASALHCWNVLESRMAQTQFSKRVNIYSSLGVSIKGIAWPHRLGKGLEGPIAPERGFPLISILSLQSVLWTLLLLRLSTFPKSRLHDITIALRRHLSFSLFFARLVVLWWWFLSLSCVWFFCNPMDYSLPGSSCPWDFPGANTGVGCHILLQRISPVQGLNLHLMHCQVDALPLCHLLS